MLGFLSLIFSLTFFSKASFAKTEVEFKSSVEISHVLSPQLEDIVILNNHTPNTIRSVMDLEIPFTNPTANETANANVTVTKEEILDWLKVITKDRPDLRAISFKIPISMTIAKQDGLVSSQIAQRMQNRLGIKCPDCKFHIQISNLPLIKAKNVNLDWKDIPTSGAFMLPVISQEQKSLTWISGQIKSRRPVVKAARIFRTGDTLQDSDLTIDFSDVTFVKDYYLQKSDLIGKKASRIVTVGNLITSNDIQREYDVKQGQTVKTVTGNESFEITLQTVAQESGVSGDMIRVRNTSNQKVISARIMDKGTVRIE